MRFLRWALFTLVLLAVVAWFAVPVIFENRMNRVLSASSSHASAQAEALHKQLIVADLHADSLLWERDLLVRGTRGHVDIPRLGEGNVAIQAFTVVTTSPRGLNIYRNSDSTDQIEALAMVQGWPLLTWNSPKHRALYQAAKLHEFAERSHGKLVVIGSRADLENFLATRTPGQVAGFLGTEGAQPLEGKLENP